MDLRLYARVLWRFRLLVVTGLVFAIALALLSVVRISSTGITYRQSQLWSTTIRLQVTQSGFPEGRLYAQEPTVPGEEGAQAPKLGIPIADPGRFNALAILYAELANSDPVRRLMLRDGPVRGKIIATPLRDEQSGTLLPLIDVLAISTSPRAAVELAHRNTRALATYLGRQQRANNVPAADRVVLQTIVQPRGASVYQSRSKTMALVVFLAVMLATIGLALLLENTMPRERERNEPTESGFRGAEQRRTA